MSWGKDLPRSWEKQFQIFSFSYKHMSTRRVHYLAIFQGCLAHDCDFCHSLPCLDFLATWFRRLVPIQLRHRIRSSTLPFSQARFSCATRRTAATKTSFLCALWSREHLSYKQRTSGRELPFSSGKKVTNNHFRLQLFKRFVVDRGGWFD